MHKEFKKVKFLEFMGATDSSTIEALLDNMAMFFPLFYYTSNIKLCMVVF
jgi:hypothetical protein